MSGTDEHGRRAGDAAHRRIARLEREVAELRSANEILRSVAAYFAGVADREPGDPPRDADARGGP